MPVSLGHDMESPFHKHPRAVLSSLPTIQLGEKQRKFWELGDASLRNLWCLTGKKTSSELVTVNIELVNGSLVVCLFLKKRSHRGESGCYLGGYSPALSGTRHCTGLSQRRFVRQ